MAWAIDEPLASCTRVFSSQIFSAATKVAPSISISIAAVGRTALVFRYDRNKIGRDKAGVGNRG